MRMPDLVTGPEWLVEHEQPHDLPVEHDVEQEVGQDLGQDVEQEAPPGEPLRHDASVLV
jgi:hypothetical protein